MRHYTRLVAITREQAALAGKDVQERWGRAPESPLVAVYDALNDADDRADADILARAVLKALRWEPRA